jgi:hypothetical protein
MFKGLKFDPKRTIAAEAITSAATPVIRDKTIEFDQKLRNKWT